MHSRLSKHKAFTLVEVLVTSIIGVIVAMGVVFVLSITYRVTNTAVAINSNNSTLNALHNTFNYTIRAAKSLNWVSATELNVTASDNTVKTIKFEGGKVKVDGTDVNIINMANVSNQVIGLTFAKGNPATKAVVVDLSITTSYNQNQTIASEFSSVFYCRNN